MLQKAANKKKLFCIRAVLFCISAAERKQKKARSYERALAALQQLCSGFTVLLQQLRSGFALLWCSRFDTASRYYALLSDC